MPFLNLSGVTLRFGGLTALDNLDLTIPGPGVYGIIGPNGAGKSTLFNLVTGIYRPTAGKVFLAGKEISSLETAAIAGLGVARTFQNIRLLSHLSVLDNLRVVAASERRGTFWQSLCNRITARQMDREILERAQGLLELMGLGSMVKARPNALPYGAQRKLEIARALMRKPRLLLLDEPAAGLNTVEKEKLQELIQSIVEKELTLVVIDHDMKFVMNLCQHVTVLSQGAICAAGTPSEVQSNSRVIETYLGKKA